MSIPRMVRRLHAHRDEVRRVPNTTVRDPRGGVLTVAAAVRRIGELRARVDHEDSRAHERVSRGQHLLARTLPLLDGAILMWFLTGVHNVDLRHVDGTAVIAAALATLATAAVAAWSTAVGQHLQSFKDRDRRLVWAAVDGVGFGMLALTAVIAGLLGVLMYVRVADEVYQATGVAGPGSAVVALSLAVAVVVVNAYVLYLAWADGSATTREMDRLTRAVAPYLRRWHRAEERADRAARRIALRRAAEAQLDRVPRE